MRAWLVTFSFTAMLACASTPVHSAEIEAPAPIPVRGPRPCDVRAHFEPLPIDQGNECIGPIPGPAEAARTFFAYGEYLEAGDCFVEAHAGQEHAGLLYNAAHAYERGGETELARRYFTLAASSSDPSVATRAREALDRIESH